MSGEALVTLFAERFRIGHESLDVHRDANGHVTAVEVVQHRGGM